MRVFASVLVVLAAVPVAAQKPWEARIDLPLQPPVELPAIPATNPFAVPLQAPPAVKQAVMRERFVDTFSAQVAAYVDQAGVCVRSVFLRLPWAALAPHLQASFAQTRFAAARWQGMPVATWLSATVDLKGRVDTGRVSRLQGTAPDAATLPRPDPPAAPTADARDLAEPATPAEKLDQLPVPKRFRASIDAQKWRQRVRFLAEIGPEGRCQRVVFLSCPDGLRNWLKASLPAWTFIPGQAADGPGTGWIEVDADLEVEMGDLDAESIRVSRETWYPHAAAGSAVAPPPGG